MTKKETLQLFESKKVRSVWDSDTEKWYISIVDVIEVLTESNNPQVYWRVLKKRLADEGNETVTNCNGLKMRAADGKMRLTDVITQSWSGFTTKEYKRYKDLKSESLRDNMTNLELVFNMLAEASTSEISKKENPQSFDDSKKIAHRGGKVAGVARKELEEQTGQKIVSSLSTKKMLKK